jgi:toxin ParE1/3/4
MANYSLSPLAVEDLQAIWRYGAGTSGLAKTEQYGEKLLDAFEFLAANPKAGQAIDHIRAGYKRHPVGVHVIFYRLGLSGIEVIRILHQRMDAEQQLQN